LRLIDTQVDKPFFCEEEILFLSKIKLLIFSAFATLGFKGQTIIKDYYSFYPQVLYILVLEEFHFLGTLCKAFLEVSQ